MFDSSVMKGRPFDTPLNRVVKGWTEGVQLMVEGEKTRFWIPGDLAYGDTPQRPGAPAGTLVFDIELLSILPDMQAHGMPGHPAVAPKPGKQPATAPKPAATAPKPSAPRSTAP
jgi:hypothetical protein